MISGHKWVNRAVELLAMPLSHTLYIVYSCSILPVLSLEIIHKLVRNY